MTFEQINYFINLAHHRTLTDTANKLHISQAGLSKAISQLEIELGFALFERTRQGTQLTEQGGQLLTKAQQLVANYSEFKSLAQEVRHQKTEIVRIALANTIKPFYERYLFLQNSGVNFRLQLTEKPSDEVVSLVRNGEFDLGLIAVNEKKYSDIADLNSRLVRSGHLRLYLPKDSQLVSKNKVTFTDLKRLKFSLFEDYDNDQIFKRLQEHTGPLDVVFHGSNEMVPRIALDLNAAILARDFQVDLSDNLIFKRFQAFDVSSLIEDCFDLCWIYRKGFTPSKTLTSLLDF